MDLVTMNHFLFSSAILLLVIILTKPHFTVEDCTPGVLVSKPNCNEYYKCSSAGIYVSYTCPTGQHFSPALSKCTTVKSANCFCKNLADGKYPLSGCFSSGVTEQYVTCLSRNVQAVSSCAAFFIYDAAEPKDSFCTTESLSACRNISTEFCANLDPGSYKIPGSCTSYVICSSGAVDGVLSACSVGTVFSEELGQCVSDTNFPISCGGATGSYLSLDGSRTDIRYYAQAILPFNVMTGINEIISDTSGKYAGAVPVLVSDSAALPYSAYSFASDYTLPASSSINFVGNPDWALLSDFRVEANQTVNFEMLNFQHSTTGLKYATLVLANNHFEVQCTCRTSSSGVVTIQTTFASQTFWYNIKVAFKASTSTLSIYLADTLHVTQSPFTCFNDCGATATVQFKQGISAACFLLLSKTDAHDATSTYQGLVCPKPSQSSCKLSSDVAEFSTPTLLTSEKATMTCNNSSMTALVGCNTVPLSATCSWSDYNTYQCKHQSYYTTWDENALCYGDTANPMAIFPFNYITQLRDVSYGLVGGIRDAIKTQSIDQTNVLKLYDGRFVVRQSLGLNFLSNFTITFSMFTTSGVRVDYRDGQTLILEALIFYQQTSGKTIITMSASGSGSTTCDVTGLDIRNSKIQVEISVVGTSQHLQILLAGTVYCTSNFVFVGVYGDFEMQAIQPSSTDYCSISCLLMFKDASVVDTSTILTYCNDLTHYYTTQLLSAYPFNVVSSTSDMFGLNDVTSPSFFTYDVFQNVPTPVQSFSAINISAIAPYPAMTLNDFRSAVGSTSDDFSIAFWLYTNKASAILIVYSADDVTLTFQLSIEAGGYVTAGIAFNIGWKQIAFPTAAAMSTWHFFTFTMQRRDANNYDARLIVLDSNKNVESQQLVSTQMTSASSYLSLSYTRGSKANVVADGSTSFISCMTYLDRPVLTTSDAISLANLCPALDVPCDYLHSTQVEASSYALPDPSVFDMQLDTQTSTCSNLTTGVIISVQSFCLVDRTIYLPRESCFWSLADSQFVCEANRTLFSPPCGSAITSESLEADYVSTVLCPALSAPPNGSVDLSNPKCSGGTVASFSCRNGSYVVGLNSVTCLSTGSWNGTVPHCKYVDCGDPTAYLRDSFNMTTNPITPNPTYYNAMYYASCLPGYTPAVSLPTSDRPNITCQSSGLWTDPGMDGCQKGFCDVPDHKFYHIVVGTSFYYNDTVTLKCLSGTQFSTGIIGITKRCNESLIWAPDDPLPACVELKCSPPSLADSSVMLFSPMNTDYSLGDIITISCINDSYQVIGEKTRSCRPDQSWSGYAPYCQIRACPDPGDVVGATRSYVSFNVNETVTYTCDEGFYPSSGDSVLTCLPTGLWEGLKITCTKVQCNLPENGTNAIVTYSSTTYNDTVLYACDTGYTLATGDFIRQCMANRSWSGSAPFCTQVECVPPVTNANSSQINGTVKSAYTYGETINLACLQGYRYAGGSFVRSCTVEATWSGQDLICEPKVCAAPFPRAKMANYRPSGVVFNYLSSVTYTCLDGYTYANGSMNRTCLEDGSWSGSTPICEPPPGQAPPTKVGVVVLQPTEAKHAEAIGIPIGAIFLGSLFGLLALLDILSIPKYYEFAKRRLRKTGIFGGIQN